MRQDISGHISAKSEPFNVIFFFIFSSLKFVLIRYIWLNICKSKDLGDSIVLLPRAASALLYLHSILEKTRASVSTNFIHHPTNCLDFLLGKSWPAPEAKFCESVFWLALENPPSPIYKIIKINSDPKFVFCFLSTLENSLTTSQKRQIIGWNLL